MINYICTIASIGAASTYYLMKHQSIAKKIIIDDQTLLKVARSVQDLHNKHNLIKAALQGTNKAIFEARMSANLYAYQLEEMFGKEAYRYFSYGGAGKDLINMYGKEVAISLYRALHEKIPYDLQEEFGGLQNAIILCNAVLKGEIFEDNYRDELSSKLEPIYKAVIPYAYHSILDTLAKASVVVSFIAETISQFYYEDERVCYKIVGNPLSNIDARCLIAKGNDIGYRWIFIDTPPIRLGWKEHVVAINRDTNEIYKTIAIPKDYYCFQEERFTNTHAYIAITEKHLEFCGTTGFSE